MVANTTPQRAQHRAFYPKAWIRLPRAPRGDNSFADRRFPWVRTVLAVAAVGLTGVFVTFGAIAAADTRAFDAAPPCPPAVQADTCRADIAVSVLGQDNSDGVSLYLSGSTPEIGWVDVNVPREDRAAFISASMPQGMVNAQIWRNDTYAVRVGGFTEPTDDQPGDSRVPIAIGLLVASALAWLLVRSAVNARLRRRLGNPVPRRSGSVIGAIALTLEVIGGIVLATSAAAASTTAATALVGLAAALLLYTLAVPHLSPSVRRRLVVSEIHDAPAGHEIVIPVVRRTIALRVRPTAGIGKLVKKLFNAYDPPHRPIVRTLISAFMLLVVAYGVTATIDDIHQRDAFGTAVACPYMTFGDCRTTQAAHVSDVEAEHGKNGRVTGYRVDLDAVNSDDPQYDADAVTGWFEIGTPPQAFMDAAAKGATIDAEVYDYSTVALTAKGITVHTDEWPSTVVRWDIVTLVIVLTIAWALLRSAGRAVFWRALGGRKQGQPRRTMRLIDLGTLAIGIAGAIVADFSITPGVAVLCVAGALLVLALFVPAAVARRLRTTRRAGQLWAWSSRQTSGS